MTTQILLLRGVNVGGVRLSMQDLRDSIADAGGLNPRTDIQSGNAVFDGTVQPERVADALQARSGLRPDLFFFPAKEFETLAHDCPCACPDGAKLHLFYLAQPANPTRGALQELVRDESYHLTDRVFYLAAPSGIGRSVLVERLPRTLGVTMTARNWNTVTALIGLAKARTPG